MSCPPSPSLRVTGLLLLLLLFIYSIAGVQLFASVGLDGQYLVAQANFQNVGLGMLLLYRWTTGEVRMMRRCLAIASVPPPLPRTCELL